MHNEKLDYFHQNWNDINIFPYFLFIFYLGVLPLILLPLFIITNVRKHILIFHQLNKTSYIFYFYTFKINMIKLAVFFWISVDNITFISVTIIHKYIISKLLY